MLATAASAVPSGEGWAYEFKWDGVRALVDVGDDGVRITSRAGNDVTAGYPEVVAAVAELGDALLDGEIVAFVDGRPSFERLQQRMHVRGTRDVARLMDEAPVVFVAFDLLRRFGVDLTARTYDERRATLERVADEHALTLSPSFDDGPATEQVARAQGLEGVVAKRTGSRYRPGTRSRDWIKVRFVRAGDFVVVGWEAPAESANQLSSLVLAVAGDDGALRYAGRVGSGIGGRLAAQLKARLVERGAPAVDGVPPPVRGRRLRWVEPEMVVEVEFTAWTGDGRLRHPVLRGERPDKRVDEARGDG